MQISIVSQDQAFKRPSLEYYAMRTLSYGQFQAIQVIYALFNQLQALPRCSEDINVIRHKTQFWLQELRAAYHGAPTHPVTQDLKTLLDHYPLSQDHWVRIITALEMEIDGLLLETEEEMAQYGERLYGSLYALIAQVLAPGFTGSFKIFGQARALLSFIQYPDHQKLRFVLPADPQALSARLFNEAGANLQDKKLKPLRVLARLYHHQVRQPMLHLGPLKTLWLSIRERLSS